MRKMLTLLFRSSLLQVLTHRGMRNSRSAIFTKLNFIKSAGLGLISGLIWFQIGEGEKYVDDRAGFIFFAMTFWVFDSMFTAMMTFPPERAIIFKERSSGSYRLSAYFLSKVGFGQAKRPPLHHIANTP